MLRLFTKNNGAVTVFLVLIMVPVITVATVFVDASRLRMAESIVNSSADLTLETVMAKYDAELSDYYGLLASAQDAEDMVNKANEYLVSAMTSKGLSADQATSLLSAAVDRFSTDDIVDMLQLSLAGGEDGGEAASVVSPAENGDLTNAAIVKKQISEFMKYRAPINLAAGIIEKFTNFKHRMDLAKEETDLMEKKQTFYETENKLLEKAYDIYKLTKEYQGHFGDDIKKYMEDMEESLNSYWDRYEYLHNLLMMDLYNSDGVKYFTLPNLNDYQDSGAYNDDHKASKSKIKSLAEDLKSACSDFSTAIRNLNEAGLTQYQSDMYIVQYWVQVMRVELGNNNRNNVFTKYADAANKMVSKWAELKSALNHKEEGVDLDGIDLDCLDSANNLYFRYIKGTGGDGTYFKVGEKMQEGSDQAIRSLIELNAGLANIQTEIQSYYDTMQKAKDTADKIASGCTELITLANDYQRDYDAWQNAAAVGQSDMAKEDKDTGDDELVTSLKEQVSGPNVTAMQTRYKNISELLNNIREDLDLYKYGTDPLKKIREIGRFTDMKNAIVADDERVTEIKTERLRDYAENSFPFVFEQPEHPYIDTIDESNNPDTINSPEEFEKWLVEKFKDVDESKKTDEGDKKRDDIKEDGENKADEKPTSVAEHVSDKEINGQPELPSKGAADTQDTPGDKPTEKASNSISKIVENFNLSNNLERLYALDYVMSMFTYDTYLYEGLYKCKDDLEYTDKVETVSEAKTLHTQTYDKWKAQADDPKFRADKTLTNKVRSMENQFSFGNEVEYILYGGTNSENKLCSYGLIYLIRFAMNTAPMFAAGWNSEIICPIAEAISAATCGIIPEPLIKTLIILALIAFESAYDIALLQQGLPVLFVKTKDDLYINPDLNLDGDGLVKDADETLATTKESNPEEDAGFDDVIQDLNQFFYSDYLTLFLFIGLTTNEENIYSRIADVIQVNMAKNTGNDGYRLSKSQVYYKIDAKVEMPAFMMKLPINQDASIWEQMQSSKYQIQYSEIRGY